MSVEMGQPDGSGRARAQRERILTAARRCFVRRGFHAASIADIAGTAEMSPGLIYRYFENKNAIVMAIIEGQLQEARTLLDSVASPMDMVEVAMQAFDRWAPPADDAMHAALFLEIAAEATRDPGIAAAVQAADTAVRARIADALQRNARAQGGSLPEHTAQARVMVLQCLIEGLAVRLIRQPGLSREAVRDTLARAILQLMAPPSPA